MEEINVGRAADLFEDEGRGRLEPLLPAYLMSRRWFGGKARRIEAVRIREAIPVSPLPEAFIVLADVSYASGGPDTYALPLAVSDRDCLEEPSAGVAALRIDGRPAVLIDAFADARFSSTLLEAIGSGRTLRGPQSVLEARPTSSFAAVRGPSGSALAPSALKGEQSNTSIRYGDRLILKFLRRIEVGTSPDLEIGRYLTETARFPGTPSVAGWIERRGRDGEPATLAILQGFVSNRGDAWTHALEALGAFFERVRGRGEAPQYGRKPFLDLATERIPRKESDLIGSYLDSARLLGTRTAELHLALARGAGDPAFEPEPITGAWRDGLVRGTLAFVARSFTELRGRLPGMTGAPAESARAVLAREETIRGRVETILGREISGLRIRCHGDYHLGQCLHTGTDFVITDFEGEPARPLRERREKKCPLQDVAGMLRSFHYAPHARLLGQGGPPVGPEEFRRLEPWARFWYLRAGASFLGAYLETVRKEGGTFLPAARGEIQALLDIFLLEKAVYELGYELNNRPGWVPIPLHGILELAG
jgi:trehalose synthase-fused probable maltokinase